MYIASINSLIRTHVMWVVPEAFCLQNWQELFPPTYLGWIKAQTMVLQQSCSQLLVVLLKEVPTVTADVRLMAAADKSLVTKVVTVDSNVYSTPLLR
jgi:hypothetical protein